MLSDPLHRQVEDYGLTLRFLWLAYSVLIPLLVAVLFLMVGLGEGVDWSATPVRVALGVGVLLVVAARLYRRRAFSDAKLREHLAHPADIDEMAKDSEYGMVDEDRRAGLAELSKAELHVLAALHALQVPFLLTVGFNEIVLLAGFLAAYLSREFTLVLPFATAALVLHLLDAPRVFRWAERLQRLEPSQPRED